MKNVLDTIQGRMNETFSIEQITPDEPTSEVYFNVVTIVNGIIIDVLDFDSYRTAKEYAKRIKFASVYGYLD